jgi:hypothetical protein
VCVCVCMCVYVYVCVNLCVFGVCACVCMGTWTRVCVCVCTCVYGHVVACDVATASAARPPCPQSLRFARSMQLAPKGISRIARIASLSQC